MACYANVKPIDDEEDDDDYCGFSHSIPADVRICDLKG